MEEFYRELGARLRSTRAAAGLSQAELSARVRLSRATVANIELGNQRVTLDKFVALATALGASPSSLLPPADGIPAGLGRARRAAGIRAQYVEWAQEAVADAEHGGEEHTRAS